MEMYKNLIIELLIQDMKHEQLIAGLKKLGFKSDLHSTDISGIVAGLLGITDEDISWSWMDVYMDFLKKAIMYEITDDGTSLLPLAETCYMFLIACAEKEKRKKNI